MNWDSLFRPHGVAVVGSVSEGKIGRVLIEQLLDGGFSNVYAVNPKGEGDVGTRAVPAARSLRELAEAGSTVDLVVVASPAATVAAVLEDAGNAGAAVIITAGFSESGNSSGEQALLSVAGRFGLRLVGPNCAGIVNTKHNLYPTLETRPPSGDVAFVSQSGALGGAVLSWAEEQGVGFSKFVSYGNGADLTDVDFLNYLRDDTESSVVCLYIETVSDGRAFLEVAARLTAVKPLIVIKAGRSTSGRRATRSHTGSLAGEDAVYDAALRQCGAIRVDTIEEMFDLCRGFTVLPPIEGRRLAIVTNSGGPGVLAADRAEALGLQLCPPGGRLRKRLEQRLQPFCSVDNPIDLTVEATEDDYRDTLVAVLEEYDAALALNVNTPYLDSAPLARGVVAAANAARKPVAACFMAGRPAEAALPILKQGDVPNFATGERAVAVIAALVRQSLTAEAQRASAIDDAVEPPLGRRLPWGGQGTEPEAMDWLESQGVSVIERRFARTADEAVAAAQSFGGAVAMKVVAEGVVHKTDVGGIVLDVRGDERAREAFCSLERVGSGRGFLGVLVTPMIANAAEVLVGVSRDPQFGPVVACGLGGIFAEALHDVSLRVAPVCRETALAMIERIRGVEALRAFRGRPPCDLDALAGLIAAVSRLPFDYPEIDEIDLNPVFSLDEGLLVGDVRVIRANEENEQRSD